MYWGAGASLGLLAALGYFIFSLGAALLWRQRNYLNLWAHDEYGALRRGVARHAACAGAFGLREQERFKIFPGCFLPLVERTRREQISRGTILVLTGPILFLLDFLV